MADMEALPEEHPAMCAAKNETLIPMPDEYLWVQAGEIMLGLAPERIWASSPMLAQSLWKRLFIISFQLE